MLQPRRLGDDAAYRRGTLFGFTLAEIVLLIIFALLLALAALVITKDKLIRDLQQADGETIRMPLSDAKLIEALKESYKSDGQPMPKPDELFRELRLAKELKAQLDKSLGDNRQRAAVEKLRRALSDPKTRSDGYAEVETLARAIETISEQARLEGAPPIEAVVRRLQANSQLVEETKRLQERVANLNNLIVELKSDLAAAGKSNLPPIIRIPTNNSFRLGEATLVPEFRTRLVENIIPELRKTGQEHDVEVIEVVGHTDELPIANIRSNLDTVLLPFLNGRGSEADLVAGDNAGLGLSRAAAVARVLVGDSRLARFRILPLSAGQVVDTDQRLSAGASSGDSPDRRRIEIRMRRLKIETRDAR